MRIAAEKGKGKTTKGKSAGSSAQEKIVRRFVLGPFVTSYKLIKDVVPES